MADLTKVKIKDGNNNISPPYNFTVDAANIVIGQTTLQDYIDNNFASRAVYQDYGIVLLTNGEKELGENQRYSIYMGNSETASLPITNHTISLDATKNNSSYSLVLGRSALYENSPFSLIIGAENTIKSAAGGQSNVTIGDKNTIGTTNSEAVKTVKNNLTVGSENGILGLENNLAVGYKNKIYTGYNNLSNGSNNIINAGSNSSSSNNNIVNGSNNNLSGLVSNSFVNGSQNTILGNNNVNFISGENNNSSGETNILIGKRLISQKNNTILLGENLQSSAAGQIIIGTGASPESRGIPDSTSVFTVFHNGEILLDMDADGVKNIKTKNLSWGSSTNGVRIYYKGGFVTVTGEIVLSSTLPAQGSRDFYLGTGAWKTQTTCLLTKSIVVLSNSEKIIPVILTLDTKDCKITIKNTSTHFPLETNIHIPVNFNYIT